MFGCIHTTSSLVVCTNHQICRVIFCITDIEGAFAAAHARSREEDGSDKHVLQTSQYLSLPLPASTRLCAPCLKGHVVLCKTHNRLALSTTDKQSRQTESATGAYHDSRPPAKFDPMVALAGKKVIAGSGSLLNWSVTSLRTLLARNFVPQIFPNIVWGWLHYSN